MKESIYRVYIRLRLAKIVLVFLLCAVAVCALIYYFFDISEKNSALLGGLLAGLIVAIIQYLMVWREQEIADRFASYGIMRVLPHREDRPYYEALIKRARRRIYMMGNTGLRVLQDFAEKGSPHPGGRVLLDALAAKVEVKFLLCSEDFLENEDQKEDLRRSLQRLDDLRAGYENISWRFYAYPPAHSIFIVDSACIVGPIFRGRRSRHTGSIEMAEASEYGRLYVDYFEQEWLRAE